MSRRINAVLMRIRWQTFVALPILVIAAVFVVIFWAVMGVGLAALLLVVTPINLLVDGTQWAIEQVWRD